MIQLNIGARFGGYSSSVGRPVVLGHMPDDVRGLLQMGLDAANKTMEIMQAGVRSRLGGADGAGVRHRPRLRRRTSSTARATASA